MENTDHIKNIFTQLVRDLISFKAFEDDARDSISIKKGNISDSKIKENQGKGCSC